MSGSTLRGLQRLQANVWLDAKVLATGRQKNVTFFEGVKPALLPLMWLEKGGLATPLAVNQVKKPLKLLKVATAILTTIGVLGCTICAMGLAFEARVVFRALNAHREDNSASDSSE